LPRPVERRFDEHLGRTVLNDTRRSRVDLNVAADPTVTVRSAM
jgi:hypothetical protein